MKRFSPWALLVSGMLGVSAVALIAADEPAKPDANQAAELFKKLDKNGDGKLVPDEITEEQGRFFDRLVRLGDKDDNGELTKEEFEAALKRSDAPVQGGGGLDRGGPGGRPMFEPKQILERLDKNKDGKLTKDELPEEGPGRLLRQVLERTEKESLTLEDLERSRAMFGGVGGPGGRPLIDPKQVIEQLDKNKDGKLTKDELPDEGPGRFLRQLLERSGKDALTAEDIEKGRAAGGFGGGGDPGEFLKRLDKNNDGKLQKDELPEPLQNRLAGVFEKLGKNELTPDEFRKALSEFGPTGGTPGGEGRPNPEEMFKRLDANGDGKITLAEVPEQFRDRVKPIFDQADKDTLTLDDVRAFAQRGREGGRPDGDRRREGEGERRPEGDRPPEDRRKEGDRPPEGDRPREGEPRRDGDRRPEAGPRRDSDRRPDGDGPGRPPHLPRFFEILDKNHDGRISREELDGLREVFKELDMNNDGQLDPAELLGPPPGDRGPDGRRPDGDRGPDGAGRPEGRPRPDGDRPPEGRKPPEGKRRPEAGRPEQPGKRPARPETTEGEKRREEKPRGEDEKPRGEQKPRDNDKESEKA